MELLNVIGRTYRKIFSIHEIENESVLHWYFGYLIFSFALVYHGWIMNQNTAENVFGISGPTCWPFFQGCGDWIIFQTLPDGYSQQYVYMSLMAVMAGSVYAAIYKKWALAHFGVLILFAWKMYVTLIHFWYNANYDYYHTTFALIFLFLPHKRFFAMFAIVFFYFLSTAAKIHETWILGTYFTSLETGLPIFPDSLAPVFTNLVIVMEMVFAWFLLSRNMVLQRAAFIFFVVFHLYSGILVGYHYPLIVLTPLLILFGPFYRPMEIPRDWKSIPGWSFALILLCLQMVSHVIPGDEKLTLEGNFYGLYMFEANHQCTIRVYDMQTGEAIRRHVSTNARSRCSPYAYLKRLQHHYCAHGNIKSGAKYGFSMEHSINGGPFYRIVKERDLCALEYKPFQRNEWIKNYEDAEMIGRPVKNFYR